MIIGVEKCAIEGGTVTAREDKVNPHTHIYIAVSPQCGTQRITVEVRFDPKIYPKFTEWIVVGVSGKRERGNDE